MNFDNFCLAIVLITFSSVPGDVDGTATKSQQVLVYLTHQKLPKSMCEIENKRNAREYAIFKKRDSVFNNLILYVDVSVC